MPKMFVADLTICIVDIEISLLSLCTVLSASNNFVSSLSIFSCFPIKSVIQVNIAASYVLIQIESLLLVHRYIYRLYREYPSIPEA